MHYAAFLVELTWMNTNKCLNGLCQIVQTVQIVSGRIWSDSNTFSFFILIFNAQALDCIGWSDEHACLFPPASYLGYPISLTSACLWRSW